MNLDRRTLLGGGAMAALGLSIGAVRAAEGGPRPKAPFQLSDAEWRKRLSPQAYAVLRRGSTEYAFTSPLNKEKRKGIFACAGCGQKLFDSRTKFESHTGWPSFWQPLPRAVATSIDRDLGYERTEVHCARCGGHLGHVFEDGPRPTGLRYCMNGVALKFEPA
ncbi:MAG: peptide-methionine (R)-S-oxide reductase MsrB [Sphingomonadales bacterium]|nr:peptide-methionine (R)-S-oxide reductase MsrB [Sphingomonadales bacterium]